MKHTARCIIIKICNKKNSSSNPYPISVHPIHALSTLCRVHRHFPLQEKKRLLISCMQQDVTLNIFFLYILYHYIKQKVTEIFVLIIILHWYMHTFGFSIGASSYRVAQRGQWSVQRTGPRWGPPRPLQPVSVCPRYQF